MESSRLILEVAVFHSLNSTKEKIDDQIHCGRGRSARLSSDPRCLWVSCVLGYQAVRQSSSPKDGGPSHEEQRPKGTFVSRSHGRSPSRRAQVSGEPHLHSTPARPAASPRAS